MTRYGDLVDAAVKQSQLAGAVTAPTQLLDAIDRAEHPLDTLCDHDNANVLFDAFYRDSGVLQGAQAVGPAAQPAEISQCAALLRWLMGQLEVWRAKDDPQRKVLVSIVVVAQTLDMEKQLWPLLKPQMKPNAELAEELQRIVASFAIEFTSPAAGVPIWEREAVDTLKDAEASGDWAAIAESWKPFAHQLHANALQAQSVRYLSQCDQARLVSATEKIAQIAVASVVAHVLPTERRLALGVASSNPFIEFASVYETVASRARTTNLSASDETQVSAVLLKVAKDDPRWSGWMKAFNAYPQRYPALQNALGACLATASDQAVEAYVHSVVLNGKKPTSDPGRKCVADCLEVFRGIATIARRQTLWTLAHARWTAWNFDSANAAMHLFEVNWCDLDFALAGYATECMDPAGRDAAIDAIRTNLERLDDQWHASITDIVTAWNRLLSRMQPYARASNAIATGVGWLSESVAFLPFDPAKDRYLAMRYHAM